MRLKNLGAALFAVLALSAVVVSSASAAATTTAAQWYTGATGITLPTGTPKTLTASLGGDPEKGTEATLESETAGVKIAVQATGLECVGCMIENKVAKSNEGGNTSSSVIATGAGKLKFTGATVEFPNPTKCTVFEGAITTAQLNFHADFMNGTKAVQNFFPATKGSTTIATFTIDGPECTASGTYQVKGRLYTDSVTISEPQVDVFQEAKKETGKRGKVQEIRTSPTIQAADGGKLEIGSKEAKLWATVKLKLNPEEEFEVK